MEPRHWILPLEIIAMMSSISVGTFVPIIDVALGLFLARTAWGWCVLCCIVVWLYVDRHTPCNGRRPMWPLSRLLPSLRPLNGYFPVRVVAARGARLDPSKNYIFCWHPHGVGGMSILALYSGYAIRALFPGMTWRIIFHKLYAFLPLSREVLMALDGISSEERGLRNVLGAPCQGNVAVLSPGANADAARLSSDSLHLYLKRRGFCRVALLEGSAIIPSIVLGEHLTYKQPFAKVQRWIYHKTGYRFIIPLGRGIFQPSFGILPSRVPITFIVGAPLEVEKSPSPSREQIEDLHAKYVEALRKLYEEYSPQYSSTHLPLVIET